MSILTDAALYRRYAGFLVFLVSILVAFQLAWLIEHQRPQETIARLAASAVVGLVAGAAIIQAADRLLSHGAKALSVRVAQCLWPAFLLVFMPFHVRLLCRWQNECDYAGDVFMVQFLALSLGVFAVRPIQHVLTRATRLASTTEAIRFVNRHKFMAATFLALALLLARGWGRFAHPEFFAEGGVVYLNGALHHGWASLFDTYAGFLHVFPRLVVLTGLEVLPLEYLTRFTVGVSFVVAALVSANFVRDRYRWLVPSLAARWMVCVLLTLVPGLYEVLGSLTALHYVIFVFVAMVFLRDLADNSSALELVCVALAVLSTSLVISLLPLAAYRVYLRRRYRKAVTAGDAAPIWRDWALLVMLFLPLAWSAQDILLNPGSFNIDQQPIELSFQGVVEGLVNVSTIYGLLFPLAGAKTIDEILPYISPFVLLVPLAAFLAVTLRARWRENRDRALVVLLWLAAIAAVLVMIYVARPVAFNLVFVKNWGHFAWWMRYHYLLAVPAVLMWFLLLRPKNLLDLRRKETVIVLIVFTSGLFHSQYIYEIERYTERELWQETVEKLKPALATGCPRTVVIEVFADKSFTYRQPDSGGQACPSDE